MTADKTSDMKGDIKLYEPETKSSAEQLETAMNAKARKKREIILEAAYKCITTHGYKKTTLDDIAKEIGLSKTAVYYYFKSKEEIVLELASSILEEVKISQEKIINENLPIVERLLKLVDFRYEFTNRMLSNYVSVFDDLFEVVPILKEMILKFTAEGISVLTVAINEAYPDGDCPVNPSAFAAFFEFSREIYHISLIQQMGKTAIDSSQVEIIEQFKSIIRKAFIN